MTRVLRRFMKPDPRECEEVRALFSEYVDAGLESADQQRVHEHVGMCPRCRQVLSNLQRTLGRLAHLRETSPPGAADPEHVGERLRKAWREQA
jgi:predicted anti-sigma-YlaC factor YlaD